MLDRSDRRAAFLHGVRSIFDLSGRTMLDWPLTREPRPRKRASYTWPIRLASRRYLLIASCAALGVTLLVSLVVLVQPARPEVYRIGVITEPGLAYQDSGTTTRSGFEIDMYRWMSSTTVPKFKFDEFDLNPSQQIDSLRSGRVDVVIGSLAITDARDELIGFAGPYLNAYQGLLTRSNDPLSAASTLDSFRGRSVCAVSGSTSATNLHGVSGIVDVERIGLSQCVDQLRSGRVDAVAGPQFALAGFQRASAQPSVRITSVAFGALEQYGIGVPLGDSGACREWTDRIRAFIVSGAWEQFYIQNFGSEPPPEARPDPNSLLSC